MSGLSPESLANNVSSEVSEAGGLEFWKGFSDLLSDSMRSSSDGSPSSFPLYGTEFDNAQSVIAYGERFYTFYAPAFLACAMFIVCMIVLVLVTTMYSCCGREFKIRPKRYNWAQKILPLALLAIVTITHITAAGFGIKASSVVRMGHAVTMKSYTSVLSYFEDFNSQSSLLVNTTFDSMVSGVNGVFSTSDSALTERWTMSSGNRVSNGSNQATAMLAISAELVLLSQTLDSGIQSLQPTFNATLASVELLSKAVFDINAIHADDLGTFELTAENRLTEKTLTSLAPSVLEKVFNGNYSIAMLPVLTSITSIDSAIQDVKALMDAQTEQAENLGKEMLEEALLTPLQQIKDSFQKEQQSYLVFAQNLIDEVDSLQAFDAIASGYLVDILASYLPIIVAVALAVSAAGILLIGFGLATPFAKGAAKISAVEKVQDSIGSLAFDEVLSYLGTFPTEFWSEIDISSGDREYIAAASQNASNGLTGDASSWFTFSPDTDRVAASETIIRNETAILQQRINDAIDQHNVLAAEHRSLINVYQQIQAKIIEFRALSTQIDEENKDVSSKETQYQDQALSIFEENLESLRQEVNTALFAANAKRIGRKQRSERENAEPLSKKEDDIEAGSPQSPLPNYDEEDVDEQAAIGNDDNEDAPDYSSPIAANPDEDAPDYQSPDRAQFEEDNPGLLGHYSQDFLGENDPNEEGDPEDMEEGEYGNIPINENENGFDEDGVPYNEGDYDQLGNESPEDLEANMDNNNDNPDYDDGARDAEDPEVDGEIPEGGDEPFENDTDLEAEGHIPGGDEEVLENEDEGQLDPQAEGGATEGDGEGLETEVDGQVDPQAESGATEGTEEKEGMENEVGEQALESNAQAQSDPEVDAEISGRDGLQQERNDPSQSVEPVHQQESKMPEGTTEASMQPSFDETVVRDGVPESEDVGLEEFGEGVAEEVDDAERGEFNFYS
ncbi:MAG: hypothetical protein SGCHY_004072 [Lobulomycetales sp.]